MRFEGMLLRQGWIRVRECVVLCDGLLRPDPKPKP